MTVVAGADGARSAWVLATLTPAGATLEPCADFGAVVALVDRVGAIRVGVDMPIALPAEGGRAADTEARALLGRRRSTLFPTPVRAVLDAVDYDDACARSRAASGKAISKQLWHLVPAIREVRDAVTPGDGRFIEVHPESTFVQLTGGPLPSKKTAAGIGRRLAALRLHVPTLDDVLADAPADCAIDDALDALAAAVSARRHVEGVATVFGADAGVDPTGHPLRIIA